MDVISPVSAVLAFVLSLVAAFFAARSAALARAALDRCTSLSSSAPASLTKRVDSLQEKLDEYGSALETVAQKVKMQRVRTAANHVRETEGPNPHTQPDEWRAWMNDRLARARLGA